MVGGSGELFVCIHTYRQGFIFGGGSKGEEKIVHAKGVHTHPIDEILIASIRWKKRLLSDVCLIKPGSISS